MSGRLSNHTSQKKKTKPRSQPTHKQETKKPEMSRDRNQEQKCTIVIFGLPSNDAATRAQLHELVTFYGPIDETHFAKESSIVQSNKGNEFVAFVRFKHEESRHMAAQGLQNCLFGTHTLRIEPVRQPRRPIYSAYPAFAAESKCHFYLPHFHGGMTDSTGTTNGIGFPAIMSHDMHQQHPVQESHQQLQMSGNGNRMESKCGPIGPPTSIPNNLMSNNSSNSKNNSGAPAMRASLRPSAAGLTNNWLMNYLSEFRRLEWEPDRVKLAVDLDDAFVYLMKQLSNFHVQQMRQYGLPTKSGADNNNAEDNQRKFSLFATSSVLDPLENVRNSLSSTTAPA